MAFEAGSYHSNRYVPEVTWGVTPSTPSMTELQSQGGKLGVTKDTFQSENLRANRQISDFRHGAIKVSGDIPFNFLYGEFDPFLESALFSTWNSNVLKAGVTPKSFTIERAFEGISQYEVFTGCMASKFTLTVPTNAIVTGSFDIVGKNALPMSGTPLDASPTPSLTNLPFDGMTGTIKEGGSVTAIITSIELSLDNKIDPAFVLGSNIAAGVTPGRSDLTGTVSAFFENATLYNKFVNETESSLEFTLGNGTTKSYTFLIPRIKYSGGGDINVSGEGRIALSMPFQALYDSTTETNIQITRIPGA